MGSICMRREAFALWKTAPPSITRPHFPSTSSAGSHVWIDTVQGTRGDSVVRPLKNSVAQYLAVRFDLVVHHPRPCHSEVLTTQASDLRGSCELRRICFRIYGAQAVCSQVKREAQPPRQSLHVVPRCWLPGPSRRKPRRAFVDTTLALIKSRSGSSRSLNSAAYRRTRDHFAPRPVIDLSGSDVQ